MSLSVQANGKKTLILDLRFVNKFLRKIDVKFEDWKTAVSMSVHIPKSLSLLRSIGGIRVFVLLFFLMADVVLKRILMCRVL